MVKKTPEPLTPGLVIGAGTKSRTRDLLITSQLLYQLSYTGNKTDLPVKTGAHSIGIAIPGAMQGTGNIVIACCPGLAPTLNQ